VASEPFECTCSGIARRKRQTPRPKALPLILIQIDILLVRGCKGYECAVAMTTNCHFLLAFTEQFPSSFQRPPENQAVRSTILKQKNNRKEGDVTYLEENKQTEREKID